MPDIVGYIAVHENDYYYKTLGSNKLPWSPVEQDAKMVKDAFADGAIIVGYSTFMSMPISWLKLARIIYVMVNTDRQYATEMCIKRSAALLGVGIKLSFVTSYNNILRNNSELLKNISTIHHLGGAKEIIKCIKEGYMNTLYYSVVHTPLREDISVDDTCVFDVDVLHPDTGHYVYNGMSAEYSRIRYTWSRTIQE